MGHLGLVEKSPRGPVSTERFVRLLCPRSRVNSQRKYETSESEGANETFLLSRHLVILQFSEVEALSSSRLCWYLLRTDISVGAVPMSLS